MRSNFLTLFNPSIPASSLKIKIANSLWTKLLNEGKEGMHCEDALYSLQAQFNPTGLPVPMNDAVCG